MEKDTFQGIPTSNLIWGILFICWGIFWLIFTFGIAKARSDVMEFLLMASPLFWVVLGIILFFHDDSKIEEVRP